MTKQNKFKLVHSGNPEEMEKSPISWGNRAVNKTPSKPRGPDKLGRDLELVERKPVLSVTASPEPLHVKVRGMR